MGSSRRKRKRRRRGSAPPAGKPPAQRFEAVDTAPPAVDRPAFADWLTPARERLLVGSLLVLFLANMAGAAVRNSGVCDELGAHIPAGYLYWTSGVYGGGIDNFPLGQLLIALPVHLLGLQYELFTEQHLLLFRIPTMLMGLLLAWAVFSLARELFGREASLVALILVTASPNVLAHATLATLDLPMTCAALVTLWLLYRYLESPTVNRLLLLGAALAAALVIKIQSVLLVPVVGLALVLFGSKWRDAPLRSAAPWLLVPGIFLVVVHIVYAEVPLTGGGLLPEPYLDSFRVKLTHGSTGHFGYLMGEYSTEGWWYYFPIAILLKTPIPALALFALGLARRPSSKTVVLVFMPMVLFLAAGMYGRVNIGLRHVLTVLPLMFVVAGGAVERLGRSRLGRSALGGLIAWQLIAALWIQPHHLSYFNLIAGGPRNGHTFLIDSNYDWGQNDHFLREFVERQGLDYRIDPDPFRPVGGHLLINANALYGVLNGGPAAYAWLEGTRPVNRIAYTWFEFDVPEPKGDEEPQLERLREQVGSFLAHLRTRYAQIQDSGFRLELARAFAAVGLYRPAFQEIRSVLARAPAHEEALRLGGEVIVRHKLGVLKYLGMEYLTGFPEPVVTADVELDRAFLLARSAGVGEVVSTTLTALGFQLFNRRDLAGAEAAFEAALGFDPENRTALDNLRQIQRLGRR